MLEAGCRHLDELLAHADVAPAVDQAEYSPYLPQRELLACCRDHGIQLEDYSPLTKGRRLGDARHRRAPRQDGRAGLHPLDTAARRRRHPKSVHRERILEDAAIFHFALSPADIDELDAFDEGLHTGWDPGEVE